MSEVRSIREVFRSGYDDGVEEKIKEDTLARDNYSYKKYQKELARKKKREEKLQSKLAKKNAQGNVAQEQVSTN